MGLWFPDGPNGIDLPVEAFGEIGHDLRIPGPLLRVPAGTVVVASVRNSVPGTVLSIHGLTDRPSDIDATLVLRYGETRTVRFRARSAGTYYYWGTTTGKNVGSRIGVDSQLTGAIVVDDPRVKWNPENDRIFVITEWDDVLKNGNIDFKYAIGAFNGREFPLTERPSYALGTHVRWRVVNASWENHPLHLHGYFFRVDSRGDGLHDTTYPATANRDRRVTELFPSGSTGLLSWQAARPGNWLFHCHIPYHAMAHAPFSQIANKHFTGTVFEHSGKMGGLIMQFAVRPNAVSRAVAARPVTRHLGLLVERAPEDTERIPAFQYVLEENGVSTRGTGASGPPLVLTRGEMVCITITNHLSEPTAVHWHGIELQDSYYDGVSGISGYGNRLEPMIMPGESFEARFAPPRAGTFIYHTHMNDVWQARAGLSGPLIVLPPGAAFDPATDHVVLLTVPRDRRDFNGLYVNGMPHPPDMTLAAGVAHRFRLINLTALASGAVVSLVSAVGPATWKRLAVDGANLPAAQQISEPAVQTVTIGQTRDFIFKPQAPGEYQLLFWFDPADQAPVKIPVHVVAGGSR